MTSWRKVLVQTQRGVNTLYATPDDPAHPLHDGYKNRKHSGQLPYHAYIYVHLSDEHEQYDPSPDVWMHVSYQTEEGLQDGWIQHRHLTWFSTPELERIGLARKELDEQERALRHVPNYRLMQLNEAAQGLAHHTKHALQSDYDATLHKRDIEHYAKVLMPMLTKLLSEADE